MALNHERDGRGDAVESVEGRLGTHRPVVETGGLAFQPKCEEIAVLAEVVKKAGQPRLVRGAKRFGEGRCPFRDILKVVAKRLPPLTGRSGMCVVHFGILSGEAKPYLLGRPARR